MSKARLSSKAARDFHRQAERCGFALVRHGKHLVYEHPVAGRLVVSGSPSDHRAVKNNTARMQRLLRQTQAA